MKRDSPVDCHVASGSSRPKGEAQTGGGAGAPPRKSCYPSHHSKIRIIKVRIFVFYCIIDMQIVQREKPDGIICLKKTGKTHSKIEYFAAGFFIVEMAKWLTFPNQIKKLPLW